MIWVVGIRTRLLVSSSARLPYGGIPCTLLITLLATSSRWPLSSALRPLPLSKVARLLRRACLTNYPLSFVPHCQQYILCKGSPLQCLDDGLRGCHPSHPHLHPPFIVHRPRLISPSPRSSTQAFRIPTSATWPRKEAISAVRTRQFLALQWMPTVVLRARAW